MRSRPLLLIVLVCCAAAQPAACSQVVKLHRKSNSGPPDNRVVSAHTAFGFDLLHQLSKTPGKNVFISPSSVAAALEMTFNGASGKTKADMAKALQIDGLDLQTLNEANRSLRLALAGADPQVEISIANSLWAQNGYPFLPDFIDRNREFYAAEVRSVDFANAGTVGVINGWVEDKTHGKIKDLVKRLDPLTRLVLANAVYFHGLWSTPFKRSATTSRLFTLHNGASVTRTFMKQTGGYSYLKGQAFQAIRLPYGADRLAMYIVLPDARSGLPELLKQADEVHWTDWIKQMKPADGSICMPKFKLGYSTSLREPLIALGMQSTFADADFSGMTDSEQLFVSDIVHKSYLEVDEDGTVAAAATSVSFPGGLPGPGPKPFEMIVDHPFLCAIRDDKTGEILFLGAIYDPVQN